MSDHMNTFERKIQSGLKVVRDWENIELLKRARSEIPFSDLSPTLLASDSISNQDKEQAGLSYLLNEHQSDDLFLQNLCRWFQSIMIWINNPPCELCYSTRTKFISTRGPLTPEEYHGQADRVEVYYCPECNAETTCFPRFNSVSKVLSTKMGRCGEYANLFGLFCRACGFETRYILDFSDHVWVEVWSNKLHRWVMADACEGVIDTPSMYEQGWGKNSLSYILAYTTEEVTDVTRRYTRKYGTLEFQQRRNEKCPSGTMRSETMISQVNSTLRTNSTLPIATLNDMDKRSKWERKVLDRTEHASSSWDDKIQEHGYHRGRISGSLEWKTSRGEDQEDNHRNHQQDVSTQYPVTVDKPGTVSTIIHHDQNYILQCETGMVPSRISMRLNDDSIMSHQEQITATLEQKILAFQRYMKKQDVMDKLYHSVDQICPFVGFTTRDGQPIYLMTKNGYPLLHRHEHREDDEDGDYDNIHVDHVVHTTDTWYTIRMVSKQFHDTHDFNQSQEVIKVPCWSKEEQRRRILEIFHSLVQNGMNANEAGAEAIHDMLKEMSLAKELANSVNNEDEDIHMAEDDLKASHNDSKYDWIQEDNFHMTPMFCKLLIQYLESIQDNPWSFHLRRIRINDETFDRWIASTYRGLEVMEYVGFEIYATQENFIAYIPVWKDVPNMKQKVLQYSYTM